MRHKRITAALASCALAAITGSTAACGSSPGTITSHGTMAVDFNIGGGVLGNESDPFSDGTQVVVVNSAGTVIGSSTLHAAGTSLLGGVFPEDRYTFTVTVPGGLPRYGLQVGGTGHGTIWETPAQMSKPALNLDLT